MREPVAFHDALVSFAERRDIRMKIGLCLAFNKGVNYGMQLQALATQRFLEKMGYETVVIDYTRTSFKHIRFTPFLIALLIKQRIQAKKNEKHFDRNHQKCILERKNAAKKFVDKYFHNIVICQGVETLEKLAMEFDSVLVGSDQQWGANAVFGNFVTLRFVPDNINKVSYATSMGISEYPYYAKSSARQFLRRFDYISVREVQAQKCIECLINRDVKVVLDPTYMLTKDEWLQIIPLQQKMGSYILCYFLGDKVQHKKLARDFADRNKMKLVSILSTESVSDIDWSYANEIIEGAGPDEFINLIRNAEYIFTDSFHGIAFSIINQKQFYAFYRTNSSDTDSRNSRIDNVMNMWNLTRRIVEDSSTIESLDTQDINYLEIEAIINERRKESYDFIIDALGKTKRE